MATAASNVSAAAALSKIEIQSAARALRRDVETASRGNVYDTVHAKLASLTERGILQAVVAAAAPAEDSVPFEAPSYAQMVSMATRMARGMDPHGDSVATSLLLCAAFTRDLEIVLALARAGAQPQTDEDIYYAFLPKYSSDDWHEHSAAEATIDAVCAQSVAALRDAGVRAPTRAGGRLMQASITCVETQHVQCLRALVEHVEPSPHGVDHEGCTSQPRS